MLMRSLPLNAQDSRRELKLVSMPTPTMTGARTIKHVDSMALLDGSRELVIEHHGNHYHLRLTRNDKLILTK